MDCPSLSLLARLESRRAAQHLASLKREGREKEGEKEREEERRKRGRKREKERKERKQASKRKSDKSLCEGKTM